MTHKEYAEKVWAEINDAEFQMHPPPDYDQTKELQIAIIAAALEKQRVACAEAYTAWHNKWNRDWFMDQVDAILNAEVKE